MPRGRHRHSPPLHRLLPPSTVAGVSLVCAGGAWAFAEPVVLRGLVAAAAAAAVVGSVVMRRWDQAAGRRVAELKRARASDEWRYEERIAEYESDLEESRELRGRLETKLRAKRAELAALRNEHAALLRRYATAETERASALEGRRLLALEASAADASAPPAIEAPAPSRAALPPAAPERPEATRPGSGPTPSLYARANAALDRMTPAAAPAEKTDRAGKADTAAEDESPGKSAAAVVPPAQVRAPVPEGGFDFFGTKNTKKQSASAALDAVQNEDLADVVGEEALAAHKADAEAAFKKAPEGDGAEGVGQVIDLTAHDETEQIDLAGLRSALRA